jgi:hypothetical protein
MTLFIAGAITTGARVKCGHPLGHIIVDLPQEPLDITGVKLRQLLRSGAL